MVVGSYNFVTIIIFGRGGVLVMDAEIIIAVLALLGVVVTAVFQYKSSQTAQQTSREKAQADELAKTKKELDEKNSQKFMMIFLVNSVHLELLKSKCKKIKLL